MSFFHPAYIYQMFSNYNNFGSLIFDTDKYCKNHCLTYNYIPSDSIKQRVLGKQWSVVIPEIK